MKTHILRFNDYDTRHKGPVRWYGTIFVLFIGVGMISLGSPPPASADSVIYVPDDCSTISAAVDSADGFGFSEGTVTIKVRKTINPYREPNGLYIHGAKRPNRIYPDGLPYLIVEAFDHDPDDPDTWPVITGHPDDTCATDTLGNSQCWKTKPTVKMTGGLLRNVIVERLPWEEEDPPGRPIRRGGIQITHAAVVEKCMVQGFNVPYRDGDPNRDREEIGILGFCASNFGQGNPLTVWDCDIHDNAVGLACGETEVIYAYNWIHDNTVVGISHGGGSVARIFSNLIENNQGNGMNLSSYHVWTNNAEISNNTICDNDGDGIYLYYRNESDIDMPLAPLIRDNVIILNGGYGVSCNGEAYQYGCFPQLRNNNVWSNEQGQYLNCYRIINSISENPDYDGEWYLNQGSPCIDAGSLTLYPGAAALSGEGGGEPVMDVGMLDLGYHHPPDEIVSDGGGDGEPGDVCLVCDQYDSDPECDYASIQDAVDQAIQGSIIRIKKTSLPYNEAITIPDNLSELIIESEFPGEDNRPTICVSGEYGVKLHSNATLRNLHITRDDDNQGTGIGIYITAPSSIENCLVENQKIGILVAETAADDPSWHCSVISYNEIRGSLSHGIELTNGSCAQVFSNWIESNAGCGIHLLSDPEKVSYPEISSNTIKSNGQDGIFLNYYDPVNGDQPLCPVIRDNIIFKNDGYGINCSMPYGPLEPECHGTKKGGIYPNIRYNDVWYNSFVPGADDDYRTDKGNNYRNCPKSMSGEGGWPGGDSGRMVMPMSFNPIYNGGKYLWSNSPCIDAGSLTLDAGDSRYKYKGPFDEYFGPLRDTGILDLGFHHAGRSCPWIDR